MKRALFRILFVLGFAVAAKSQSPGAPNEGAGFARVGGNSYRLSWDGHLGRSYFVQHSEDLLTWAYFPDILELGTGDRLGYTFSISGPNRSFLRLKYTDIPTSNPYAADFDGDGLSNWDELQRGTDPLARDTDGDGMSDGNEFLISRNPLTADSPVDASDRLLDVHTPLAL